MVAVDFGAAVFPVFGLVGFVVGFGGGFLVDSAGDGAGWAHGWAAVFLVAAGLGADDVEGMFIAANAYQLQVSSKVITAH